MKRQFQKYTDWEDFRSGMYELPTSQDSPLTEVYAGALLKCPPAFYNRAIEMIQQWPVAARVNLSNRSRNRQAWIGQATCCFAFGAREHQTKSAWHTLAETEQRIANRTADEVIELWEKNNA